MNKTGTVRLLLIGLMAVALLVPVPALAEDADIKEFEGVSYRISGTETAQFDLGENLLGTWKVKISTSDDSTGDVDAKVLDGAGNIVVQDDHRRSQFTLSFNAAGGPYTLQLSLYNSEGEAKGKARWQQ